MAQTASPAKLTNTSALFAPSLLRIVRPVKLTNTSIVYPPGSAHVYVAPFFTNVSTLFAIGSARKLINMVLLVNVSEPGYPIIMKPGSLGPVYVVL